MVDRNATETKTLDDVRLVELAEIVERRNAVGLAPREGAETDFQRDEQLRETAGGLVGLALSGGGMRSASFNLGLLQALCERGLLRFVDYLSTVSGGGYVGSLLTSSLCRDGAKLDNSECPLTGGKQGLQERIRRFIGSGTYLLKLFQFANRYLIGTLLNNIAIFSGLVLASALVAWLWRCLDSHGFRDRLSALGLDSDIWPALLPGIGLGVSWLAAWGISYWRSGQRATGRVARTLMVLTIFGFLIGLAILIGNGDVTIRTNHDMTSLQSLRWPIGLATGLGLTPFLLPRLVVRSGASPKNLFESWIFYYASAALLLGVPLLLIGLFGRENISGFASQRGPQLRDGDLKDAERFAYWISRGGILKDAGAGGKSVTIFDASKLDAAAAEALGDRAEVVPESADWRGAIVTAAQQVLADYKSERVLRNRDLGSDVWNGDSSSWFAWKYGMGWRPVRYLADYVLYFGDENCELAKLVDAQVRMRTDTQTLLDLFNEHILPKWDLPNNAIFITQTVVGKEQEASGGASAIGNPDPGDPPIETLASERDGREVLDKYIRRRDQLGVEAFTDKAEVQDFNRRLLEDKFPDLFRSRAQVRRATVIDKDQYARLMWCAGALLLFVLSASLIRPNDTSLQGYYRNRLAQNFLELAQGRDELLLREIDSHRRGAPYHLLGATANALDWRSPTLPMERFVFSPKFCGGESIGFATTEQYGDGRLDLATAMAVSGAAVSPSYFRNWLVRCLLLVLNLRLGQWLPNPAGCAPLRQPTILQLLWGLRKPTKTRPYLFVTDGGHGENLGLGELLARRCSLIVVSDAGQDSRLTYCDFAKLIQAARIHDGIEFLELDGSSGLCVNGRIPAVLASPEQKDKPDEAKPLGSSARHYFCAKIRYPHSVDSTAGGSFGAVKEALLVYIKPSLSGDEDLDVTYYKSQSPEFPHEATADQAFEPQQVEAYRRLGYHIGLDLCRDMTDELRSATETNIKQLAEVFTGCRTAPARTPVTPQPAQSIEELVTAAVTSDPGLAASATGPAFSAGAAGKVRKRKAK